MLLTLSPCWSVLDFWKINLEKSSLMSWILVDFELDFYCLCSMQKSITIDFCKAKNPVRWTWFFQLDFSKFQYRSTRGKLNVAKSWHFSSLPSSWKQKQNKNCTVNTDNSFTNFVKMGDFYFFWNLALPLICEQFG